eukprot:TRINITY_DN24533_c0_g1_i1.p1 TRINITY_DN24533_c0_g1~~TRINITY_DN24533_c0_g1_i1.p1  ORF type:complete len:250 (+),score=32.55 TRINITY_DN24533_c0_g1_i1:48-797(+)
MKHRQSTNSVASEGSVRSFRSTTSKLSVLSASAAAINAIDGTVQEAFEKKDYRFLINLLGIGDTICGFLRLSCMECIESFIKGEEGWEPYSNDNIQMLAHRNWPQDERHMMSLLISTQIRIQLRPIFKEHANSAAIKPAVITELITVAGGETLSQGDRGEVFIFAECCRLEYEQFLIAFLKGTCASFTTIDIFHSRLGVSEVIHLTSSERRKVSKFLRQTLTSASDELDAHWYSVAQEAEDEDECCTIL